MMKYGLIFGVLFCSNLMAQFDAGEVIVCPHGAFLKHHYEARKKLIPLEMPGLSVRDKVNTFIDRIRNLDSLNGASIATSATSILNDIEEYDQTQQGFQENSVVSSDVFYNLIDKSFGAIPSGCKREQLFMIRNNVYHTEDKSFEIRSDLWNLLSTTDKAMAISYASVFKWFLEKGSQQLEDVSYMTNYFIKKDQTDKNIKSYFNMLTGMTPRMLNDVWYAYSGNEKKSFLKIHPNNFRFVKEGNVEFLQIFPNGTSMFCIRKQCEWREIYTVVLTADGKKILQKKSHITNWSSEFSLHNGRISYDDYIESILERPTDGMVEFISDGEDRIWKMRGPMIYSVGKKSSEVCEISLDEEGKVLDSNSSRKYCDNILTEHRYIYYLRKLGRFD